MRTRTLTRLFPHALVAGLLALTLTACGEKDVVDPSGPGAGPGTGAGDSSDLSNASWVQKFSNAGLAYSFGSTVKQYFRQRGLESQLTADGQLSVPGDQALLDLDELAMECSALPSRAWTDAIAAHFGELEALIRMLEHRTTPAWADAKARLRIRMHTDAFLEAAQVDASTVVCRRDLPGMVTCVVLDDEQTALIVPRTDLDTWDRPISAVFAIAIENTRAELADQIELAERELPFGALRVVTSSSFYSASAVMWLQDWPSLLGKHGAFVIAPWQRAVFAWPFNSAKDTNVVQGLYLLADKILDEEEHIDSLSPDVYWRRADGTFEKIEIERTAEGTLQATPPADLLKIMQGG